eukprot:642054-Pleurochrysis_carterae.AAC.1
MRSGTCESSEVWSRHLSTPRAEPVGKAREASRSASTGGLAPKSCLLMLGCVLNWKPGLSPMDSGRIA